MGIVNLQMSTKSFRTFPVVRHFPLDEQVVFARRESFFRVLRRRRINVAPAGVAEELQSVPAAPTFQRTVKDRSAE
jgi:hypothetical protein